MALRGLFITSIFERPSQTRFSHAHFVFRDTALPRRGTPPSCGLEVNRTPESQLTVSHDTVSEDM